MGEKFDGCVVHVYGIDGSSVAELNVLSHDDDANTIDVTPAAELVDNAQYCLLILAPSVPYAYSGTAEQRGEQTIIKLAGGEIKERRSDTRYKLVGDVAITAYLWEGKVFTLRSPLKASLINISKNGIRISMKYNSMLEDDVVHIRLMTKDTHQVLTAHVVNMKNNDRDSSDYGCRLVEKVTIH